MYIIEKMTRELEKFDAETVAVLNEIAKDNKGFDYGTIAWEDWGSDRTKKPYSWPESISKANFVPTPKRTPEGYKAYYESQKPK